MPTAAETMERLIGYVRAELRDFPDTNESGKVENVDDMIRLQLLATLDEVNETEPLSSYTLTDFPKKRVLILGAKHKLMGSEAVRIARQLMRGASVGYEPKYQAYSAEVEKAKRAYFAELTALKQRAHHDVFFNAWVTAGSDYDTE